jgi:hypothetical protein
LAQDTVTRKRMACKRVSQWDRVQECLACLQSGFLETAAGRSMCQDWFLAGSFVFKAIETNLLGQYKSRMSQRYFEVSQVFAPKNFESCNRTSRKRNTIYCRKRQMFICDISKASIADR